MKINKLYIKNLNSLKGEHVIDFDNSSLNETNLFLISGPTGAGKSTILDAISLALFNEIPRFGKISKSSIEDLGAIMTHNCDEAIAEIDYTVNSTRYRSRWSIRKTRNGTFSDYTMELTNLTTNQIIPLKKSEVPSQNETIIQLSAQQFQKSILLSQGEFAQFLKAKPEERSELLEKLTGTTIYRILGKLAFEKNKEVAKQYEDKKQEYEKIILIEEEDILNYNSTITLSRQTIFNNNELLKIKNVNLEKTKTYNSRTIELNVKQRDFDAVKAEEVQFITQLKRLEGHKLLNPLRESITLHEEALKSITKEKSDLEKVKIDVKSATQTMEAALNEYVALVGENVKLDTYSIHMKNYEAEYTVAKTLLTQKEDFGKKQKAIFSAQIDQVKDLNLRKQLSAKGLPEVSEMIATTLISLKSQLSEQKYFNQPIDSQIYQIKQAEITQLKSEIDFILNKLTLIKSQHESIQRLTSECQSIEQTIQETLHILQNDTVAYEKIQLEYEKVDQQYIDLKKKAPLVEVVQTLKIGDECPICGSEISQLHHHDLALLGALDLQKSHLFDQIEKMALRLQNNKNRQTTSTTFLDDKIKQKGQLLAEIPEEYKDIETLNLKIDSILKEQLILVAKLKEINFAFTISEQLKLLQDLNSSAVGLREMRQDYSEFNTQFKEKYKDLDIPALTNDIQEKIVSARESLQQNKGVIQQIELSITEKEQTFTALTIEIEQELKTSGINSIDLAKSMILSDNEYKNIEAKDLLIKEKSNILSGEIAAIRKQILALKEEVLIEDVDQLEAEIKDLNLINEQLNREIGSVTERLNKNQIELIKKNQLKKQLDDFDKVNRKWRLLASSIGDAEGKKFAHYAQTLSLKHLLSFANARLNTLTDRYLLVMPVSLKNDLEIIDTYQGNVRRTVKSLSGGETFIVSLALALSLSDLASRNNPIDCLFIDEGFGTLDPDTLEVAMNTLDNLQYQTQKQIGIISHVASLKERITSQIVLKRDGFGYSTILIK